MNTENWVKPDPSFFNPKEINGMTVWIRVRHGSNVKGKLHFDAENADGQIRLRVSYDESPIAGLTRNGSFYLNQEQLDEVQAKGASCVLLPPLKPN
jgi:hypothetical protein